jgi:transcriptional regulator with XRE-family HTH domain
MLPSEPANDASAEDMLRGGVAGFAPAKLRQLRARVNLTADALGAAIGVSGSTIRRWEAGQASPRPQHLVALAVLFERSPDEFRRVQVPANMRALRESAGLSMRVAAERCGVSESTISRIELGTQRPASAVLATLAAAYGVSPVEVEAAWARSEQQSRDRVRRAVRES